MIFKFLTRRAKDDVISVLKQLSKYLNTQKALKSRLFQFIKLTSGPMYLFI